MYSQIQNADSDLTKILLKQTGLDVLLDHQLSTKKSASYKETIHVSFVKIHQQITLKVLYLSLYLLQESSMMCILPFHSDTITNPKYIEFIHVTDLKMVIQSSRSGVKDSLILVMISDATSVPGVQRLTLSPVDSFGADQHVLMSSQKRNHFRFRLTDNRTLSKMSSIGITTIQTCRNLFQISHHSEEDL
jgi:hypothetical protein